MRNNIKLVASDLDGTLLNREGQIGPKTKEVLTLMHEKGVLFVPCTGRAYVETPDYFKKNSHLKYLVTSNGALISDSEGQPIQTLGLSMEKAREVMEKCAPVSSYWTVDVDGVLYSSEALNDDRDLIGETEERIQEYRKTRIFGYDTDFLNSSTGSVRKLHFMVKNAEHKKEVLNALKDVKDIMITWSGHSNVEVQHPLCKKGNAIEVIMQKENITSLESVGFGDNTNDLSLFEAVGLKVAVENASLDLKEASDDIAETNQKEGVALYISQLLGGTK